MITSIGHFRKTQVGCRQNPIKIESLHKLFKGNLVFLCQFPIGCLRKFHNGQICFFRFLPSLQFLPCAFCRFFPGLPQCFLLLYFFLKSSFFYTQAFHSFFQFCQILIRFACRFFLSGYQLLLTCLQISKICPIFLLCLFQNFSGNKGTCKIRFVFEMLFFQRFQESILCLFFGFTAFLMILFCLFQKGLCPCQCRFCLLFFVCRILQCFFLFPDRITKFFPFCLGFCQSAITNALFQLTVFPLFLPQSTLLLTQYCICCI